MKNTAIIVIINLALLLGACTRNPEANSKPGQKRTIGKGPQRLPPPPPPYDVKPLVQMLRPGVQEELVKQLGLKHLADLPFYDMKLTIIPAESRLEGECELYYLNNTGMALQSLPLLLHPNAPRELNSAKPSGTLEVTAAKTIAGPKVTLEKLRLTLMSLKFSKPLQPGKRLQVKLSFKGILRRLPANSNDIFSQALSSLGMSGAGMGTSDYGLLAQGDGILTIASAYPMVAPFRGGKFDKSPPTKFGDLAYNALGNYRATVKIPEGYTVTTNLLDQAPTAAEKDGTVIYNAVGAGNRDFVLVAGQNLQRESRMLGPISVHGTVLAKDSKGGQVILDTAVESLRFFQQRFGKYPYVEMDVAEATLVGGAGGVEFPGMVLVAGMLYRSPSRSSNPMAQLMKMMGSLGNLFQGAMGGDGSEAKIPASGMNRLDKMVQQMAVFTTAHEVAHQYFAGLVGADCRVDPAVDEPLAQFAAGEYLKHKLGPEKGQKAMDTNAKLNYGVYRMLGGKDRQVDQPVRNFPSALAYAAIVYGKAPYFYVDLQKKLGAKRLNTALRRAVNLNRYKLVTLEDWIRSLQKGAGAQEKTIRELADRWFKQLHGDKDLGVDESGDLVLAAMLGQKQMGELKQNLGILGMKPRDMFRMLMGKMLENEQ